MKFKLMLGAVLSVFAFSASAATLDFTEVGATDVVAGNTINLSNATITGSGDDMFVGASGVYGEANGLGIVCATPVGSGNCEEDMSIAFASDVANLSFGSFGVAVGDSVTGSAYLNGVMLGSTVVTTQTTVDFSGLGNIDYLFFADNSTEAGIGWGDFLFDEVGAQVPLPAGLPLLLAGLGVLGVASRRKKA